MRCLVVTPSLRYMDLPLLRLQRGSSISLTDVGGCRPEISNGSNFFRVRFPKKMIKRGLSSRVDHVYFHGGEAIANFGEEEK